MTFQDLASERLIVVRAMVGAFRAAAKRLGTEFTTPNRVRSAEVAISLVHAGSGVSVVPECMLDYALLSKVAVLEFDEPWAVRRVHIATPSGRTQSPAAEAFIRQLLARPADDDLEAADSSSGTSGLTRAHEAPAG